MKITDVTDVTVVTVVAVINKKWHYVRGAHIQAFTFSSQDHGRLSDKHISKRSR